MGLMPILALHQIYSSGIVSPPTLTQSIPLFLLLPTTLFNCDPVPTLFFCQFKPSGNSLLCSIFYQPLPY